MHFVCMNNFDMILQTSFSCKFKITKRGLEFPFCLINKFDGEILVIPLIFSHL